MNDRVHAMCVYINNEMVFFCEVISIKLNNFMLLTIYNRQIMKPFFFLYDVEQK